MNRQARPSWALALVLSISLLIGVGLTSSPVAGAVPRTRIQLTTTPPSTATSGASVTMAGSVVKGVRGQRVQLQLRNGGAWTTTASASLGRQRTFSLRSQVYLGANELRVVAVKVSGKAGGSVSAVRTTHGRPAAPAEVAPDTPFAVTGQLAQRVARPVQLQANLDDGWTTVARATSAPSGAVSLSTSQDRPTSYRVVAPAARVGAVDHPAVTTLPVRVLKGLRPPAFAISTLPRAYRNVLYNYAGTFGSSTGWTHSVVSGELPPGMEIEEGFLGGTPTTTGSATFTVRISAPGQPSAERTFTLEVAPNGSWLDTDLLIRAVDHDGRYAAVACDFICVDKGPEVIDLSTGAVQTGPLPSGLGEGDTTLVEDISSDGEHVLFYAGRDNSPFQVGTPSALYLWDRVGGDVVEIADGGPALYAGSVARGYTAAVDGDGSTVVYEVTRPGDEDNGTVDDTEVLLWERGAGTTNLSAHPSIGDDFLTRPEISDDGRTVSFLQTNWSQPLRIRLWHPSTDTFTDVTPPIDDARGTPTYSLSADGQTVVYPRKVGSSPDDPDVTFWETALWDRATGSTQVVSRTVSGVPMRSSVRFDVPTAQVSGDGRVVYFESNGDFFEEDLGGIRHVYAWEHRTGEVTPLPRVSDDTDLWPDLFRDWAEPSHDGSVVFVQGFTRFNSSGTARYRYRFQLDPRP